MNIYNGTGHNWTRTAIEEIGKGVIKQMIDSGEIPSGESKDPDNPNVNSKYNFPVTVFDDHLYGVYCNYNTTYGTWNYVDQKDGFTTDGVFYFIPTYTDNAKASLGTISSNVKYPQRHIITSVNGNSIATAADIQTNSSKIYDGIIKLPTTPINTLTPSGADPIVSNYFESASRYPVRFLISCYMGTEIFNTASLFYSTHIKRAIYRAMAQLGMLSNGVFRIDAIDTTKMFTNYGLTVPFIDKFNFNLDPNTSVCTLLLTALITASDNKKYAFIIRLYNAYYEESEKASTTYKIPLTSSTEQTINSTQRKNIVMAGFRCAYSNKPDDVYNYDYENSGDDIFDGITVSGTIPLNSLAMNFRVDNDCIMKWYDFAEKIRVVSFNTYNSYQSDDTYQKGVDY